MLGVVKAIGTTMRAAFRKPVTVQYPTEKKELPHRSRGFPVLLWDFEKTEPFCTGCQVCARYCPVDCITVTMKDNPQYAEGKSKRKKTVDRFFLDYARCMRCDICVEVCNFDAIVMNNTWEGVELSRYDRQDLVMDTDALLQQHRTGQLIDPFREPMGVAHSGWAPHIDEGDIIAKRASQPETAFSPRQQAAEAEAKAAAETKAKAEAEAARSSGSSDPDAAPTAQPTAPAAGAAAPSPTEEPSPAQAEATKVPPETRPSGVTEPAAASEPTTVAEPEAINEPVSPDESQATGEEPTTPEHPEATPPEEEGEESAG